MATTEQALSSGLIPQASTGLSPAPQMAMQLAGGSSVGAFMPPQVGPARVMASMLEVFQQPAVRKAMPAIMTLVLLVTIAALFFWFQEPPYRVVFPGMVEADQQAALDALKIANYNPRIDVTTGQLTVPSGKYHEARILLASQGIPKALGRGILDSLKDQSALTTSQFMEQARYGAAIEQELARSITQIGSIQTARVHLAQPKQSAFVRERAPVKASVIVTPFSGRLVSPGQVQAIVHLVASSIPYLSAEDVSVVDNLGNLISKTPGGGALGLTSLESEHKSQSEEVYRKRIIQLLESVVGEGNVRAQVDLVMNFTDVETATEDYDARKEGPKTRSEVLSEDRGGQGGSQGGVPGSLSNKVPDEAKATADTTATDEKKDAQGSVSSKTTRNYELDKTVRHVRNSKGGIERVSVAVVINDKVLPVPEASAAKAGDKAADKAADKAGTPAAGYNEEELQRFAGLVKGVVGFSQDRGDVVNLLAAKFEPVSITGPVVPWYENDMALNGLKVGLAAMLILAVLLVVVRPMMKSYTAPPGAPVGLLQAAQAPGAGVAEPGQEAMTMADGESLEDFKDRLKKSAAPKKSSISADMLDTANTYDDKVALIRMLVQEDSGRVANVLKNMIKRDMAG